MTRAAGCTRAVWIDACTCDAGSDPPASTVAGLPVACTSRKLTVTAPKSTRIPAPRRPITCSATPFRRDVPGIVSKRASDEGVSVTGCGTGWAPAGVAATGTLSGPFPGRSVMLAAGLATGSSSEAPFTMSVSALNRPVVTGSWVTGSWVTGSWVPGSTVPGRVS